MFSLNVSAFDRARCVFLYLVCVEREWLLRARWSILILRLRAFVGGRGDWRKHLSSNGAFVSLCVRIDRSSISILLGLLAALSSLLVSSSHRFIIIIVLLTSHLLNLFYFFHRLEDFLQAETSFRKSPSRRRVEDCR